jgi:ribosome-associated toxin RatA of RatAB toxin-antitoxin module
MAQVKHEEIFHCPVETFYKIISDYEKYPEFLKDVKEMKVLKKQGNKTLVEYTIHVVKTFKYQLWMEENPPHEIRWHLHEGDLFKVSNGYWKLEPVEGGKKTKATYFVEVEMKLLVPSAISKAVVSANLPDMMKSYHERVKSYVRK